MKLSVFSIMLLAGVLLTGTAPAQIADHVEFPSGFAASQSICVQRNDGSCVPVSTASPLPVSPKQDNFQLVSVNVPASPATVYGGQYMLLQACSSYGSVIVRYRGPDGVTMTPLLTKTSADSGGGTLITLGANATVDATVNGATGCNVTLARVP